MQSRLYINGREVRNPVARGLAATLVLGFLGVIFLLLSLLFLSIIGVGIGIGLGVAGLGLGGLAIRRVLQRPKLERLEQELPPAEQRRLEEKNPESPEQQ